MIPSAHLQHEEVLFFLKNVLYVVKRDEMKSNEFTI